jgi:hypothetical protein
VSLDRRQLAADLTLVGAAVGPVGIVLGLAGGDAVTVAGSAAAGLLCLLRLVSGLRGADLARLRLGTAGYLAGAAALALGVGLAAGALVACALTLCGLGLSLVALAELHAAPVEGTPG